MNRKVLTLLAPLIALAGGLALGRLTSPAKLEDSSGVTLRLELLARANALQVAVGVLSALDEGRTDVARTLVDGQLRSSLTMLQTVTPTVKLSTSDAATVKSATADAESYIKKHGGT